MDNGFKFIHEFCILRLIFFQDFEAESQPINTELG